MFFSLGHLRQAFLSSSNTICLASNCCNDSQKSTCTAYLAAIMSRSISLLWLCEQFCRLSSWLTMAAHLDRSCLTSYRQIQIVLGNQYIDMPTSFWVLTCPIDPFNVMPNDVFPDSSAPQGEKGFVGVQPCVAKNVAVPVNCETKQSWSTFCEDSNCFSSSSMCF